MAVSSVSSSVAGLSKAEYLKRYLSADEDGKKAKGKIKKKRPKVVKKGFKIVDDDVDWRQTVEEEKAVEEEEDEAPVIAEVIDERPDDVIQLENFRTSNKWKIIGVDEDEDGGNDSTELSPRKHKQKTRHGSTETSPPKRARHDSPDVSPPRKLRHDSPDVSPPRRGRHDSPDLSPPKRVRHDSPDISPPRKARHDSPDMSPPRKSHRDSPDLSPHRRGRHDSPDLSPPRQRSRKSGKTQSKDSSPTRRKHKRPVEREDYDQSPKRSSKMRHGSDSDQSPPRRRPQTEKNSDGDLSPPRRPGQSHGHRMLSGGKAGLVSVDVLRKEKEENRQREKNNKPLEEESRNAHTVFRDKSGKRRNLDLEREEQQRKAGEKAAKDEKYAQWGKGLAQGEMHQQKLEYALQESQKPLARHYDDEDLDRLLREQEREGDPMAAMLRRKKNRTTKTDDKPRYKGPQPPPNRFNIQPGYRWDGVDRSNGFEQKYFKRLADKKAGQEEAYKWSVEDM